VREDLIIGVGPVRILDSQVKQLRGNLRDDVGDGGSHEEILSSPIPW